MTNTLLAEVPGRSSQSHTAAGKHPWDYSVHIGSCARGTWSQKTWVLLFSSVLYLVWDCRASPLIFCPLLFCAWNGENISSPTILRVLWVKRGNSSVQLCLQQGSWDTWIDSELLICAASKLIKLVLKLYILPSWACLYSTAMYHMELGAMDFCAALSCPVQICPRCKWNQIYDCSVYHCMSWYTSTALRS